MLRRYFFSRACVALLVCGYTAAGNAQFPRSVVDRAQADSGAKLYAARCARCHGDDVRGTSTGPDMMRSLVVLHDRREMLHGKELVPILSKDPDHNFHLKENEVAEISQFLTASINGILRSGYDSQPKNLTTGDAKAGEAYFNGAGGCSKCHSTTGDLAGVGKRYSPATLQQKFLFPNYGLGVKKVQLTVTQPSGKATSGELVRIDDFTVSLRDTDGVYHSFNRTPGTRVTTVNPFAGHVELLDKYTDNDIHNLTTYLATLK